MLTYFEYKVLGDYELPILLTSFILEVTELVLGSNGFFCVRKNHVVIAEEFWKLDIIFLRRC